MGETGTTNPGITGLHWLPGDKCGRSGLSCGRPSWGPRSPSPLLSDRAKATGGPDLTNPLHPGAWEAREAGAVPRTPAGASKPPALPPHSPATRSPTCTLLLDQFHRNVFYEHADGMARARGKVLPWDKKLTLANSKFTACIFIFLIPAPSASNWGSTSLFSPLFLQPTFFSLSLFFFRSQALQPASGVGCSHPTRVSRLQPAACNPSSGQGTP